MLPVPPRRQRQRILTDTCADLLQAPQISRLARCDALAPAVATRAASVLGSIREDLPVGQLPKAFELLVGNTLNARGHQGLRRLDEDTPKSNRGHVKWA